jgi:Domain of unknown function (DUF4149)
VTVLRTLAVICVAAWLGIMTFFSFEVAPIVFRTIDRAVAGQAVTAVLPRYYQWGVILATLALVAAAIEALRATAGRARPLLGAALCAVMLATLVWASAVLMPRAEHARRTRDDTTFSRAHRAAVQANVLALAAGAAFLILDGVSRWRSRGR